MRQSPRAVLAISSALALAFAGGASALIIDDFEEGDFTINDTNVSGAATGEQTGLGLGSVVGGTRQIRLETTGGPTTNPDIASATLLTTVALDAVSISAPNRPTVNTPPPPVQGSQTVFSLIYDGLANGTNDGSNGTLGIDLSGVNVFVETAFGSPTPTGFLELTLWDSDSSQVQNATLVNGFSEILVTGAGVDLTDIRAVRVRVTSLRGALSILSISTIPEPGTAALVLAGLAALAVRRRRAS